MNTAIQAYGTNEEITALAHRFKTALRGGDKLNTSEVIALAQITTITKLNPFIGELWYIPGKGPMIGIAGARRLWNEKSAAGGGYSFVEIIPCSPAEAGATENDVVAAFRAEAHDSGASAAYQKLFMETVKVMRESGSQDPFADTREIIGKRPMWVGYGYSTKSETSRMNKMQLARKRAEADALKKCITVPFGAEISAEYEAAPAFVEGVIEETQPVEVQVENENQDTGELSEPVELINPMGADQVKYAAEFWNISTAEAAKTIASKKLGQRMEKKDFIALVTGAQS